MNAKKSDVKNEVQEKELQEIQHLEEQLAQLEDKLSKLEDSEKRARADYHNLVRRTQEERSQLIKLATKSLVSDLVQPLGHLSLAAQQLKDQGLDMVISQLWQVLEEHGLKEINPLGEKFDLNTMDAVDREEGVDEDEAVVVKVVKTGYILNGEVIQHAKVVMGRK